MNAGKLKAAQKGNERIKSFVVGDPENPKRELGITVNEHVDDGHVEMAVVALTQDELDTNHGQYVAAHLNDTG